MLYFLDAASFDLGLAKMVEQGSVKSSGEVAE